MSIVFLLRYDQSMKLSIAVVGLGVMGTYHVQHLSEMEEVTLTAVCDVDAEKVKEYAEKFNCKGFTSVDTLLAECKLDAVCIIAPTSLHFQLAKKVLEHNCNVFIEKPISNTIEEAKELIALANAKKLVLTVGHIERFNPTFIALKQELNSGRIGTPVAVTAHRASPMPVRIQDANVMLDLAVHDIDLVNDVMQDVPIKGLAHRGKAQLEDREDFANMFLDYEAGNAIVQVNWVTPFKIRTLHVTCTAGFILADLLHHTLTVWTHDTQKAEKVPVQLHDALRKELEDFAFSITSKTPPTVTGDHALAALKIALSPIF